MRRDFWFDSCGMGQIHGCRWEPQDSPRVVVQIVHGIGEYVERYDEFANYLTEQGCLVVAEDHMGHGQSVNGGALPGYFHGGWAAAVADTYHLLKEMKAEFPDLPYILFGHSMGSFMARTILCQHPDSGITCAVISGTCWQPPYAMPSIVKVMEGACALLGETKPNDALTKLVFGAYNARVEHPRTSLDWVSRDAVIVDNHPMHLGFRPTAGLLRDMMKGIWLIEKKQNLAAMKKDIPVLFVSGGDDPVGSYGKGIHQVAECFRKVGMKDVTVKLFPLCRHEILNEINREEVYHYIQAWMEKKIK